MRLSSCRIGVVVHDKKPLPFNMMFHSLADLVRSLIWYQAKVDGPFRLRADDVCRLHTHVAGLNTMDVQRGLQDLLRERRPVTLRYRDCQFLLKLLIDRGGLGERPLLDCSQRPYVVIESGNQDLSLYIAHAVDQVSQQNNRIGCPVAIVPTVKGSGRTIARDLQVGFTSRSEEDLHAPRLMDRPITQQPKVSIESIGEMPQDFRKVD